MDGATRFSHAQLPLPISRACSTTTQASSNLDSVHQQEQSASQMHHPINPQDIGRQILQIILANQEPAILLSELASTLGKLWQTDWCLVVAGEITATSRAIGCWSSQGVLTAKSQMVTSVLCHPLVTKKLTSSQLTPVAISQLSTTKNSKQEPLPCESLLLMTFQTSSLNQGAILLGYNQKHQWTDLEKNLLQLSSDSLAIALSQIHLQYRADTKARYQILLNELVEEIGHNSNLEQILTIALHKVMEALEVDQGISLRFRYSGSSQLHDLGGIPRGKAQIICQLSENQASAKPSQSSFKIADSYLCQQALQQAPQTLVFTNKQELKELEKQQQEPLLWNPNKTGALLMVPVMGSHSIESQPATVLGFLVLQENQARCWQTEEIEVARWISNQASKAIIHHQTLHQVQMLVEERTTQLKRSLEVQAKLYEKTRQHVDQLRHLNQLKDDFLSTVQDELKHPLTKMKMAIEMLKIAPDSQRRQRHLEILELECHKEISLVNDLLTLQRLESHQYRTNPQKLDLKLIVGELTEVFESEWGHKKLTLAVNYQAKKNPESSLTLYTDSDSIRRILQELLSNAGRFSPPDTTVSLEITRKLAEGGEQMLLKVTNIGPIITAEEQEYIFDKFRRGKSVGEGTAQGTGLGLALVKSLVECLNGKIEVWSSPSKEGQTALNSFTLTLPRTFQP